MSLTLTANSGGADFAPHPQGVFAARCVRIIDLGTQESEYMGEKKKAHKIILAFETSETMTGGDFDGKPFLVTTRYTASLHEKSALRKDLKSWRGRDFTEAELAGFHLKNVLKAPAMLNIVHTERNGRTYANIANITPLPKGMSANPPSGDVYFFDLENPDLDVFEKLSDKTKALIEQSPEWKARMYAKDEADSAAGPHIPSEEEDDIPFASSNFMHDVVSSKQKRMSGYDY